jgi:hypothetical protein
MNFKNIFYIVGSATLIFLTAFIYGEYKIAVNNGVPLGYQLATNTPIGDKFIVNDYCVGLDDYLNNYSNGLDSVLSEITANPFKERNRKEATMFAFDVSIVFDNSKLQHAQPSNSISEQKRYMFDNAFNEIALANKCIADIESKGESELSYYMSGILPRRSTLEINTKFAEANEHINNAKKIVNQIRNTN